MLSNAYLLAKVRFDTAENEPAKILQKFANFANFANPGIGVPLGLLRVGVSLRGLGGFPGSIGMYL